MLNPKILLKHFGIFWAVFIALQLLVSVSSVRNGLANLHAGLFKNVAHTFLPELNLEAKAKNDGEILFTFYNQKKADEMVAEMKRSGKSGNVNLQTYEYGIDPGYHVNLALIFLIAIFMATPLAWKKRFLFAGIGIVLFYIYSIVRMNIKLKYEVSQLNIGLYESDPSGFLSLHKLNNFFGSLGLIFMVIILIWAILIFTKKNMEEIKLNMQ